MRALLPAFLLFLASAGYGQSDAKPEPLKISWERNYITIKGDHLPGKVMKILYMEAYCRDDAHEADWRTHTVVGHKTDLISASPDGTRINLRCRVNDGLVVHHVITSTHDEIDFKLSAFNSSHKPSEATWAQPCIRVGAFTGLGDPNNSRTYEYLKKSWVFLDEKLSIMPTKDWAKEARYIPGQVWAAPGVKGKDVNPRPLNPNMPSNGLIGCFSADDKMIFAVAWEPYHELFQGVITCLHSDFRLGNVKPGETKKIRGKIYFVPNDVPAFLKRYAKDFPEHVTNQRR